ncbi:MAG: tRNA lysidine(34) synthetase TilS [Sphingobacteriales bacterium]|nr:MAG: tRNA lysidine(34) synthetase TilS [Sphingobacteriales bacterium]
MNPLVESFKKFVSANNLFTKKDQILLAVSGGVDSVVLCELCFQCGYSFSIAHCNFQLRGQESDGDEQFVKALAKKYNVPFFVQKFETEKYASENKISIQVAARALRYDWFKELLNRSTDQLKYLLTAHHADDNIETIAMNFFKGSGINGLKGILPKQNSINRPLLFATKEELLAFAKEQALNYREDSSNESNKYTRNYFRNELLPGIEKVFPEVKENLLHNAARFKDIHTIYESAIEKIKAKLLTKQGNEVHIPVLKLQNTEARSTVLYEIIKEYGFTALQTGEALKLLQSESGKYIQSATHRILRNRKWLIIAALQDDVAAMHVIERDDAAIKFSLGELNMRNLNKQTVITKDANTAQLDAKHIKFPLLLRKWKTGDYFYPLGMPKKKKISRFLIDQKLSLHQKKDVWVVESDKKIIWVVGYRIDDRFKINDATAGTLSLSLVPGGQTN